MCVNWSVKDRQRSIAFFSSLGISVLLLATDVYACSCPEPPSFATNEIASRIMESGAIVVRLRVLQVHRDPARPDSDVTADVQLKESYGGDSQIRLVTTAPNQALCGVALVEGTEGDFLLTKEGRAELCSDILLRSVPNLIEEIRLWVKRR